MSESSDNSLARKPGDAVDVHEEGPVLPGEAPACDEDGAIIGEEELRLVGDFLPDLLQEMLRQLEADTKGERK